MPNKVLELRACEYVNTPLLTIAVLQLLVTTISLFIIALLQNLMTEEELEARRKIQVCQQQ